MISDIPCDIYVQGDWNAKVGSQETPGVTGKFGLGIRNESGQRLIILPRKCTGHSKHPLPTTQEKTLHLNITKGQYQNQIDYIFAAKDREDLYSLQKKTRSQQ